VRLKKKRIIINVIHINSTLQRARGTETQLICKHFKLIPLMKDGSSCKPRVQTAEELTAACLPRLNSLHQQISLSTQALSRISQFFTIPGNTQTPGLSAQKVLSLAFSMFSFLPVCRPVRISEIRAVLGHSTAYIRDSYLTFRNNLSVPSSRVKKYFSLYSSSIFFILENANDTLFRNVGKELPLYAR